MTWLESEGLVQNSEEWFLWRMKHIGASEIPTLMGTSHWGNDARAVFTAKTQGALRNPSDNFATMRGKRLEPIILSMFEDRHGERLSSPTLEYPEWPILSASLDGLQKKKDYLVEIKAPSFWKHTQALCGLVPECYEDQVQTQLLVTGIDLAYYVSYSDFQPEDFQYAEVIVRPDKQRQALILETAKRFWENVLNGKYNERWNEN